MRFRIHPFALLAAVGLTGVALASERERAPRAPLDPKYVQECASCHTAFPPGLLPAASWQRIMNGLQRHYGTDASVDPATARALAAWLAANAGTGKRGLEEPPQDRITRSAWFVREHREVAAADWKLPAVKSAANCAACHTGSDKGEFNERNVRIPR